MTTLVTGLGEDLAVRVSARLPGVELVPADPSEPVRSAGCLLHLAPGDHDALAHRRVNAVRITQQALAVAEAWGVDHVVVVSSAMVYGAWPNNPVPLTEDAPLRPDANFAFANQLGQVEQLVDDWRAAAPGRTATVLRPALTLAMDGTSSIVRALAATMGTRLDEADPPAQFLHMDDLAAAVVLAHDRRPDGVFNVAPDGWVPGERVRALAGSRPRVKLPSWLVDLRWRFERGPIPPGLQPYVRSPWLVANDRLRALGWTATVTNEQAYVEGTESKWWTMLTPKRKQELSLGAMIAAIVGLAAGVLLTVRKAAARRSRR